jgi:flagellar hook-associated protein 1 FlgK
MGTGFLSVGISGLNAAQTGILTTSHNISNASTPGFNRQQIVQTTNTPLLTGAGFLGQGTNVTTIKRIFSENLNAQVLSAQSGVAEMDTYTAQINQIANLLADATAGLQPALSAFFSGVNDVAANPSSIASRQSMLAAAQGLVGSFQATDQRLSEIRDGVNTQLTGEVSTINTLASALADINQRIVLAQASGPTQPANDLLDQRDKLIADLNKEIKATTITQSDGTYSVFIGNGQPLVIGTQAFTMQATPAPEDLSRLVVSIKAPGGNTINVAESLLTGGALGGLIAFRNQSLDAAQNALGRIAIAVTQTVNAQHQLGQDLSGALGKDLFSVSGPVTQANAANIGGAVVTTALANTTANNSGNLTTSDYRLSYDGSNYTLLRLSDNVSWSSASLAGLPPSTLPQGFTLSVSGAMAAGDSFLIEPTRTGARNISLLIKDPVNIAAASPIRTTALLANTGTGTISAGSVNALPGTPDPNHPATDLNLRQPVTITFTSATTYSVTGTGVAVPTTGTYVAGANISYNGWTVQISGTPAINDVFTIGPNSNGISDNRNILAIGQLQTAKVLEDDTSGNATASFNTAYSQIVSSIGNKAREVAALGRSQQNLFDTATAAQQSMSGVNLDEEAANLLRYQQAYQASAKVFATASKLFDSILALN